MTPEGAFIKNGISGCDTTSKIGTKLQAFRAAIKQEYTVLKDFGITPLDENMYVFVEYFLLECMSRADGNPVCGNV